MTSHYPYPIKIAGGLGSPYSIKMRAVLRYRRFPHQWVYRNSSFDDLPAPSVLLLPALSFPDESGSYPDAMVDSSPLIMRLEDLEHDRSLVPVDPVVAFVDYLLEDFGDEWVTKAMYHYRWFYELDVAKAQVLLPLDLDQQVPSERLEQFSDYITDRQKGRMALVGSTEANRPIIEASYERLLDLLAARFSELPFLLGSRPGRGDFGIFGQLSQLIGFDPVPRAIAEERAPRVVHWTMATDDLGWLPTKGDGGWIDRADLGRALGPVLEEMGATYAPFMIANSEALATGASELVCIIVGREYRQEPFKYQGKCLEWLRDEYAKLSEPDRVFVERLIEGTGLETLF